MDIRKGALRVPLVALALLAGVTNFAEAELPAAAFIDVDRTTVGTLVEADLLQRENVRWLERAEIDHVLREQEIGSLFDAKSTSQRARLGELLQADVLILLRENTSTAATQLTVCETKHGLRLVAESVPHGQPLQPTAKAILKLIDAAIMRSARPIREIVAVPPFINNDLTYQHDFLKSAYARLIEQIAIRRPDILVVELEEARAISRELALAGSSSSVRRPLPLYLLGEFRHEDRDAQLRVSIRLQLVRGKTTLQVRAAERIAPTEAALFLSQVTAELLDQHTGSHQLAAEPATEAEQLAERAEEFKRLGNWAEAIALIEASLLLLSDQPNLHRDAAYMLCMQTRELYDPHNGPETFIRKANLGLNYYERSIDHVRQFLPTANFHGSNDANFTAEFWAAPDDLIRYSQAFVEIKQRGEQIHRLRREMLVEFLERQARNGRLMQSAASSLLSHFNREFNRKEVAPQVGYDARLRLIRAWQDHERAEDWTIEIASCEYSNLALIRDSYPGFLDQIAAIDSPAVKAAARLLRQQFDKRIAPVPQRPRVFPRPTPAAETSKVVFHKLELSVDGRKILDGSVASARRLWIRGAGGVDITWTAQDVTVINSEGQVRTLYKAGDAGLASVCYDGSYVWGLLPLRGESPVVAIEPHSGRVIHFTAGDGFPPMTQGAVAAAIAPGSICIAGGIGKEPPQQGLGRGWIALVGIDVAGKRSLDLIHEARIHTDRTNETREDQFNPHLAFQPDFMFTLRDPGDPANVRLLLSRRTGGWNSSSRPLLIDPNQKSVKVLDLFLPTHLTGKDYTCHDDTLYWASRNSASEDNAAFWKLGFPDFKSTRLGEFPDSTGGIPVFFNGQVHVFGQTWYVSSDEGRSFATINAKAPGTHFLRYLCTSHHDGLILLADNGSLFDHYRVGLSSKEPD